MNSVFKIKKSKERAEDLYLRAKISSAFSDNHFNDIENLINLWRLNEN